MEFKATEIAGFLNGEIVGQGNTIIFKVSKIEEGNPCTLSFLANLKYGKYICDTKTSVVLVNKTFESKKEISATLDWVDNAYRAFAAKPKLNDRVKSDLRTGFEQPGFVHNAAIVFYNLPQLRYEVTQFQ